MSILNNLKLKERDYLKKYKERNEIIEKMKLLLIINNKIIIKEKIINRLIELYDESKSKKNENLKILFNILSYIWLFKSNEIKNK